MFFCVCQLPQEGELTIVASEVRMNQSYQTLFVTMAQFLSSLAWHYLGQRSLQGMANIVPSERFTGKPHKDGKTDGLTERRRQLSNKGWERLEMSCAP